jgi:3-isopropylmalate dehydratase small subunit
MEAAGMNDIIQGRAYLLGDEVNTDLNCSAKYLPGKDNAYIAAHAYEQLAPGFASRFQPGGVIVAGRHFGINSSREQAVHVMRIMGVAAIVARSFGRQFFRNAINNGLPVVECDTSGIVEQDALAVDLAAGLVTVAAKGIIRNVIALPMEIRAILAEGGLIPFLQKHPNWELSR